MGRRTPLYVVINHEEQYSIWPSEQRRPAGWRDIGRKGSKEQCLEYIEEVWTDMRPSELQRIKEGKLPR
jgi:MbtH protein